MRFNSDVSDRNFVSMPITRAGAILTLERNFAISREERVRRLKEANPYTIREIMLAVIMLL